MNARKLDALVRRCQGVMVEYLVPDGIDAETAMAALIGLLDGPEQREAQAPFTPGVPYMDGKPFVSTASEDVGASVVTARLQHDDNVNAANPDAISVSRRSLPECQT